MRPASVASLVLCCLLVATAAGCVQPDAPDTVTATGAPAPTDPFHPSVASNATAAALVAPKVVPAVLVGEPGAAEPNIAVAPDGGLFIVNPGQVWRSADGGKTWSDPVEVDGGGDGDLAVDGAGRLHYLGLFGEAGAIPYSASTDGGKTWSKAVDISDGSGSDREWIDATPDGHLYATWRGSTGMESATSMDAGATWSDVVTAGEDGDGGPIAHDPVTGRLIVPVVDLGPLAGTEAPRVRVLLSDDEGATWRTVVLRELPRTSPVEPNGYNSDFPVVAFDGAGTAYLVYSADATQTPGVTPPEEASRFGIFLQVSHDGGETWSEPSMLSTPGKSARFPWVAAGAPGRIAVAWYQNQNGIPSELLPDLWDVVLWESIDADAATPHSVRVDLNDGPSHLGAVCTSGTGCLAADRSLLDFFELALGTDGQPKVAWASSVVGTGLGVAVQPTQIHFSTVEGTSLL